MYNSNTRINKQIDLILTVSTNVRCLHQPWSLTLGNMLWLHHRTTQLDLDNNHALESITILPCECHDKSFSPKILPSQLVAVTPILVWLLVRYPSLEIFSVRMSWGHWNVVPFQVGEESMQHCCVPRNQLPGHVLLQDVITPFHYQVTNWQRNT